MIINGIDVILPESEEPLPPAQSELQSEFMQACINAFVDKEKPAFLELPEGTNRKVTLLCSALAWIESGLKNHASSKTLKTKVLYLCESNDDLDRSIQEYKNKIQRNYNFNMTILDSLKNFEIFYQHDGSKSVDDKEITHSISHPIIFFCTHKVFLEAIILHSSKDSFSLDDTLVIVDDAHLVDRTAKEAASVTLSNCVFQALSKDLENVDKDGSDLANFAFNLKLLKTIFTLAPCQGGNGWIHYSQDELRNILKLLHDVASTSCHLPPLKKLTNVDINKVLKFILHIYNFNDEESKPCKAYATLEYSVGQHHESCKQGSQCKTIKIMCLDPSALIKRISKCGASLVFTSGSISPISAFKTELQIESSNDFLGRSYIEDFQVYCRIVTCGAGGYYLNSSYSTRHDTDYLTSVGKTLMEFAKLTPQGEGLFVYFVSADFLDLCVSHWKIANPAGGVSLWNNICKYKEVIVVSRKEELNIDKLNVEKGTCVLVSIRGQVSEVEVPIENRRVMVFVGLPFMFTEDPELNLKKKYISDRKLYFFNSENSSTLKRGLSASKYEEWEAYKLINRVIDRFITSKSDHGVIFLCDTRYNENELSPWIQSKIQRESRFSELLFELKDFFCHVKERVLSISEKEEELSTCTQFGGNVKKWEFEKSRLDYLKLKKQNDRYSGKKTLLENILKQKIETNKALQQDLQNLKTQMNSPTKREHSANSDDEIPAKLRSHALSNSPRQEDSSANEAGGSIGNTLLSPLKNKLSQLEIKSPGKEGSLDNVEIKPVSPEPGPSGNGNPRSILFTTRKRPHHMENTLLSPLKDKLSKLEIQSPGKGLSSDTVKTEIQSPGKGLSSNTVKTEIQSPGKGLSSNTVKTEIQSPGKGLSSNTVKTKSGT